MSGTQVNDDVITDSEDSPSKGVVVSYPRPKRHNKMKEFVIDPTSQQFSASRICLLFLVFCVDTPWVLTTIFGWNACPKEAWLPITTLLVGVTGAVAGVYFASTRKTSGWSSSVTSWFGGK